ncbi:MAG: MotA/TolQ/ExbB proton channel family protein [Prosthecobacter sp.]|nr:MotA/TolQ/ExbB proton channel family protein [Prosthecobacter sp.]
MIKPSFTLISRHRGPVFVLLVLALASVLSPDLLAQTADAAAEGAEVVPKSWWQKWIADGGMWMTPLGLCSVISLTYTVLCAMTMTKSKFTPAILKTQLLDLMHQCRVRSAIETAAQSPTFLGRMMTVALPHFDATKGETLGREDVESAMADFAGTEMRPYQKWITNFSVLAQIAPMLGLFGTVVGMVGAFQILAQTGGAEPSKLAGDISVALLTTFAGLFVAIPSLALFFFFKNRLNDLVAESVATANELLDACVNSAHGEAKAAKIPEGIAM